MCSCCVVSIGSYCSLQVDGGHADAFEFELEPLAFRV